MTSARRLGTLVAVLVAASCASESPEPESADDVVMVPDGEQLAAGTVVDASGLVDASEFHFDEEAAERDALTEVDDVAWLAVPPPGWDLRVVWTGLPCHVRPEVEVAGHDGRLASIRITVGPVVLPDTSPPADCDSMAARHVVHLRTTAQISPDMELTREP